MISELADPRIADLLAALGPEVTEAEDPDALADLKRQVYQYGKRRCDVVPSKNNLKYHLGYAFDVMGALDIDSIALTGVLAMPGSMIEAAEIPDQDWPTFIDFIRFLLSVPALREWSVQMGQWLQWQHSAEIYRQEVTDFKESAAYKNPAANWRSRTVKAAQHYLIGEICRLLVIDKPELHTRGAAFDFIDHHGGNPRFLKEPVRPAIIGANP